MKVKNNEEKSICSACKGECCKRIPGIVHPDQKEFTKEILIEMLNGDYIFDYWDGSEQLYYLRPRTVEETKTKRWVRGSWGDKCSLLTEKGCSLKFKDRPHQCKTLKPQEDFNCVSSGMSKFDYAKLWMKKHGKTILQLIEERSC